MSINIKFLSDHENISGKSVFGDVSWCPLSEVRWVISIPSSPPSVFEAATYNQNEAISVNECFSFSRLSLFIFINTYSSAIVNYVDSNALNTNRSLTQSKEALQVTGNAFQCFYSAMTKFLELTDKTFVQSSIVCSSNISTVFLFYSSSP
jgi:hypothetical protein